MGLYSRSLLRLLLFHVVTATLAGTTLFVAVDLVETGNLAENGRDFSHLLRFQLLKLPVIVRDIAGLTTTVGIATGVTAALRSGEIQAAMSLGARPSLILLPAGLCGLLAGAIQLSFTEWVLPKVWGEIIDVKRALRLPLKPHEAGRDTQSWFRGEGYLMHVDSLADRGSFLGDVTILSLTNDGRIRTRADIETLRHKDQWQAKKRHRAFICTGVREPTLRQEGFASSRATRRLRPPCRLTLSDAVQRSG